MSIEFGRLGDVDPADLLALFRHPLVGRAMPLLGPTFSADDARSFVDGKESLWAEHGLGPWAFFIDDRFAGWGGLQPESGDADLALVLHPDYWGRGREIHDEIMRRAFGPMGFDSVTILLPLGRTRPEVLARLGFSPDGHLDVGGVSFCRYRRFRA